MKLLFDQNLSPKLVRDLRGRFPGSVHVQDIGLGQGSDADIWTYARKNGFAIVSKDSDFSEISIQEGCPPKVIWLQLGNCQTDIIGETLMHETEEIMNFMQDDARALLLIFR